MTPDQAERLSRGVVDVYRTVEEDLVGRLTRRLRRGITTSGWADEKLAEMRSVRAIAEAAYQSTWGQTVTLATAAVTEGFNIGLREAGPPPRVLAGFVGADTRRVTVMVRALLVPLENATRQGILRAVPDAYRSAVFESSRLVAAGGLTRQEATQRAWRRLVDSGITGFRDEAGRRWHLDSYTEMATRTAVVRSAVEGHVTRLGEQGISLVRVSDSPEECPMCRPWEGRILTTGFDVGYPTLDEARAAGLFHPNCTHTVGAYVPGVTPAARVDSNPVGYESKQRQRFLERQVRDWRRRQLAAVTPQAEAQARAKANEWRSRLSDHVASDTRTRLRARERPLVAP